MIRNARRIPTFVGLFLLVVGVAIGVLLVQQTVIFRLGASVDQQPQDVRTTNITDTSFTVSWVTEKPTLGALIYGSSNLSLGEISQEEIRTASTTHRIILSDLRPKTKYLFKIISDGTEYGQWTSTTGPTLSKKSSSVLSGTVTTKSGIPVGRALVYVTLSNASPLSSITDQSGTFSVPLSSLRITDLTSYARYNKSSILSVFVQTRLNKKQDCCASAQVAVSNTRPIPPLILGETHDFRNLESSQESTSPQSNIIVAPVQTPVDTSRKTSGFTPLGPQTTTTPTPLIKL